MGGVTVFQVEFFEGSLFYTQRFLKKCCAESDPSKNSACKNSDHPPYPCMKNSDPAPSIFIEYNTIIKHIQSNPIASLVQGVKGVSKLLSP